MIDEETIERISTAFQETLGHNNESAINRGSRFALCKYCKGFFKRLYLSRHVKKCFAKPCGSGDVSHPLTQSYIYTACQKKYGEV
nr:unnamed protein product [Callosobruchus chinensis]CAH7760006.1 unnamed protein product [Callosobruchus chinensis]